MDLQDEIASRGMNLQVVFITGHGNIPLAVRAVQAGAIDFVEKPFFGPCHPRQRQASDTAESARDREKRLHAATRCLALLTPSARDVFDRSWLASPVFPNRRRTSAPTVHVHPAAKTCAASNWSLDPPLRENS